MKGLKIPPNIDASVKMLGELPPLSSNCLAYLTAIVPGISLKPTFTMTNWLSEDVTGSFCSEGANGPKKEREIISQVKAAGIKLLVHRCLFSKLTGFDELNQLFHSRFN